MNDESDSTLPPPPGGWISIEDAGFWNGSTFTFDPPITVVSEQGVITMREIDTAGMTLGEGVERDDVIHALLNQYAALPE